MSDVDPSRDDHGPEELAAADALDARIDAVLAGRPDGREPEALLRLATAIRTDPPVAVARRVEAAREADLNRRWRPVRYAAAVLGYLFFAQGVGNLVWGDWVAEGIGDPHSPHLMRESGWTLMAVGIAVGFAAVRRRMVPVAVAAGVPLALALGVSGVGEIGEFAAGAVLHISEGVAGIVLAVLAWRARDRAR